MAEQRGCKPFGYVECQRTIIIQRNFHLSQRDESAPICILPVQYEFTMFHHSNVKREQNASGKQNKGPHLKTPGGDWSAWSLLTLIQTASSILTHHGFPNASDTVSNKLSFDKGQQNQNTTGYPSSLNLSCFPVSSATLKE